MNKIVINGKSFEIPNDANVSIVNNTVIINGKTISECVKIIGVLIRGNPKSVTSDLAISVDGNVDGDVNASGSVNCDDVKHSVRAGGSVNCDNIGGSVQAGGSINCDNIWREIK